MAELKSVITRSTSQKIKKPPNLNLFQRTNSLQNEMSNRNRNDSMEALEELVQCGICLEKLSEPRMLPCQHTFCLSCMQSHFLAKKLNQHPTVEEIKCVTSTQEIIIKCPVCQQDVNLEKGFQSLEALPKNLYIDTLLKLVVGKFPPSSPKTPDCRCSKCRNVSELQEQCCQHCMQVFCNRCWNEHLAELETNLSSLINQVDQAKIRLDHKLEDFQERCQHLVDTIQEVSRDKIEKIKEIESGAMQEVSSIAHESKVTYRMIYAKIEELLSKLNMANGSKGKITAFMVFHRETSKILRQVGHFGEARLIFDPETFRLDQDTEVIYTEIEDTTTMSDNPKVTNPFESTESMVQHYKMRNCEPKLVWNKCPRPAHVGIPPWNNNLLYITATDTHTVLLLNRDVKKLQGRLAHPDMVYPQGIAFSSTYQEVYISDKWAHCVHVFSSNGDYKRTILSKGSGEGRVRNPNGLAITSNDLLVVSDTGNERIIIINPLTGQHISTIGIIDNRTTLNMPTGVAVSEDKIIVADTGDHRIKIFDMKGNKVNQFGALGRGRGQFRSAEVVAVGPLGFILVGDGGNGRVQVFKPDGSLVKIFRGLSNGFGWVSGISITEQLDIIITDSKNRTLTIF